MEKIFLANANIAFDTDKLAKLIKETLKDKEKQVDDLHRQLGKRTAKLEWSSKKLKCMGFVTMQTLVKSKLESQQLLL